MRTNNISESTSLYSDDGKHHLFVHQFSVTNLTADLIDTVESTTETWEAMVDSLRHRLARRSIHSQRSIQRNAHHTSASLPDPTPPHEVIHAIYMAFQSPAFVNALQADRSVGYELWKVLPADLQKQIVELRNQHFPLGSGGCTTIMPLLPHHLLIKATNHKLKDLSKEEVKLM